MQKGSKCRRFSFTMESMKKLFSLFILIFTIGCTTKLVLQPADTAVTLDQPIDGVTKLRYKLIKIESSENARSMVFNHLEFLKDFYKQSKDPYFGTDRWSSDCIKRNQIGTVVENSSAVFFKAFQTTDPNLKIGNCGARSLDTIYLVGQCKETGYFYEMTVLVKKKAQINFQCPSSIVLTK
jgi:hypothetical protein